MARKRQTNMDTLPEAPAGMQPEAPAPAPVSTVVSPPAPQYFTEDEHNQLVDMLNIVSKKAEFNGMSVDDMLRFVRTLGSIQKSILPKIRSHQFEILGTRKVTK